MVSKMGPLTGLLVAFLMVGVGQGATITDHLAEVTLTQVNQTARLNCTIDHQDSTLIWKFQALTGTTAKQICSTEDGSCEAGYELSGTDLSITSVTTAKAGNYTCNVDTTDTTTTLDPATTTTPATSAATTTAATTPSTSVVYLAQSSVSPTTKSGHLAIVGNLTCEFAEKNISVGTDVTLTCTQPVTGDKDIVKPNILCTATPNATITLKAEACPKAKWLPPHHGLTDNSPDTKSFCATFKAKGKVEVKCSPGFPTDFDKSPDDLTFDFLGKFEASGGISVLPSTYWCLMTTVIAMTMWRGLF